MFKYVNPTKQTTTRNVHVDSKTRRSKEIIISGKIFNLIRVKISVYVNCLPATWWLSVTYVTDVIAKNLTRKFRNLIK